MKKRPAPHKNRSPRTEPSRPPRQGNGNPRPGRAQGGSPTPRLNITLYGHHAVREAILNPNRVITAIYATEDQADMVDDWVHAATRTGAKRPGIHMPDRAAFDAALPREAVHQGVGITCDPLPDIDLDDILRGLSDDRPAMLVMLDQVTDPHNFGAILRSACAFGAAGVVVQRRHAPDISGLIAKTACGAVDHIAVVYETNLARSIEQCKDAGFTVVGLDERGESLSSHHAKDQKILLVLGAEGPGLRRLVREGCDRLVSLPTHTPIASLNVSNAAAVALYHFSTPPKAV